MEVVEELEKQVINELRNDNLMHKLSGANLNKPFTYSSSCENLQSELPIEDEVSNIVYWPGKGINAINQ